VLSNPGKPSRPTIAVALHLYFPERWPEMAALIRQAPRPFTLFVTLPESSPAEPAILAEFPEAKIRYVPNVGRDVAPFLSLLRELMAFDLVCKLHAKRDTWLSRTWRIEAVRGLLGGTALPSLVVDVFAQVPELMMAGSGALFVNLRGNMSFALNKFEPNLPLAFGFFAGTMFWTRPALFADFAERFPVTRFEPHREEDGQLEHAVERLFGARVADRGGLVGLTRIADGIPEIELIPATAPRIGRFGPILHEQLQPRYGAHPTDWYAQPGLLAEAPMGMPFDPA
jgi:lipopolysaccharide biosynthesis protein